MTRQEIRKQILNKLPDYTAGLANAWDRGDLAYSKTYIQLIEEILRDAKEQVKHDLYENL